MFLLNRYSIPATLLYTLFGCTINIYQEPLRSQAPGPEPTPQILEPKTDTSRPIAIQSNGQEVTGKFAVEPDTAIDATVHNERVTVEAVLDVEAYGPGGGTTVELGDALTLRVKTAVDAYVSCFYQQGQGDIFKLFPNQYTVNSRLEQDSTLFVPGAVDRFRVVADKRDKTDQFMCLMSAEDVLVLLPPVFRANRLQRVPVTSFDRLYELYRGTTEQNLVARVVQVEVQ